MANSSLLARLQRRPTWRMTPQRRVIAQALAGEHVHLTAEQVLERVRAQLPEVSLATVYNTLNELVARGEIQQVATAGGPTRYDPNTKRRHHHLMCLACGELHDVFPVGEANVRLPNSQRFGYRIVKQDIFFRGYCPRCSSGPIPGPETARTRSSPRTAERATRARPRLHRKPS